MTCDFALSISLIFFQAPSKYDKFTTDPLNIRVVICLGPRN